MCRHERELLLAADELFIGSLALGLEYLAEANEGEVDRQLEHFQGLRERVRGNRVLVGGGAEYAAGRVAPAQAKSCEIVQWRGPLRGEALDDLASAAGSQVRIGARHPARDGIRRERADFLDALANDAVEHLARASRALVRSVQNLV